MTFSWPGGCREAEGASAHGALAIGIQSVQDRRKGCSREFGSHDLNT